MLKKISIEGFLFIEHAEIELDRGFNVITGETGAGKSILLGAVNACLGGEIAADSLHPQAKHFRASLTFDLAGSPELLKRVKAVVPGYKEKKDKSGELTLLTVQERPQGKSQGRTQKTAGSRYDFINSVPVERETLMALRDILIDIHSQRQNQYLLKVANHLHFFDSYLGGKGELRQYAQVYQHWQNLRAEWTALSERHTKQQEEKNFLEFTKKELSTHLEQWRGKGAAEMQALKQELHDLEQREQRSDALYQFSSAAQEGFSALKRAEEALSEVMRLAGGGGDDHSLVYKQAKKTFIEEIPAIEEAFAGVKATLDSQDLRSRIDTLQAQLAGIEALEKKYGIPIADLQRKYEHVTEQLAFLETAKADIASLEEKIAADEDRLLEIAKRIHANRRAGIRPFEERLQRELDSLGMETGRFSLELRPEQAESLSALQLRRKLHPYGFDRLQFLYASAQEMKSKPLKDIASGGELSRMMLALKVLLADKIAVGTMVFDEIDVGVGGLTAGRLAEKLHLLGGYKQILVITHLPQIARRAQRHFRIEKAIREHGRLGSQIERLEDKLLVEEICRMLGRPATAENLNFAERFIREDP